MAERDDAPPAEPADPADPADRPDGSDQSGQAGEADAPDQPAEPDPEPHDEQGLDLARSIARSLAGARRAVDPRARRTPPRPGRRHRRRDPEASGAFPDDRDPQTLDRTLGRLVAEQGWSTDVRMHGVFSRWDTIVGRDVAQHCRPESFAEGRLVVRTDSTAWATQVRLLAPTVVRRLNEELGDGSVTVIDVQGPRGPTWRKGPRSVRDGRGPRDTYG